MERMTRLHTYKIPKHLHQYHPDLLQRRYYLLRHKEEEEEHYIPESEDTIQNSTNTVEDDGDEDAERQKEQISESYPTTETNRYGS